MIKLNNYHIKSMYNSLKLENMSKTVRLYVYNT